MLTSVSGEINELGIKLRDLKNILADAKRRNTTDESIRWWVQELNRAMYDDVTDILERYGSTLLGKSLAVARIFSLSVATVTALLIRRYLEIYLDFTMSIADITEHIDSWRKMGKLL